LVSPLGKLIRWRPYSKEITLVKEEFHRLFLNASKLDRFCAEAGLPKVGARHYNVEVFSRPINLLAPRFCYLLNRPLEGFARIPGGSFLATGYIGMYRRER
jgi:hypothetical protein